MNPIAGIESPPPPVRWTEVKDEVNDETNTCLVVIKSLIGWSPLLVIVAYKLARIFAFLMRQIGIEFKIDRDWQVRCAYYGD
jgi:hypothetical protein